MEEKLREACSVGDSEAVVALLAQNIDVNSKNTVNGWTALHWACKRGNEEIARILLNHGADTKIEANKGETPANVCTNPYILSMLGETDHPPPPPPNNDDLGLKFTPNYLRNAPLNGQVDIGRLRPKHADFSSMPTTTLPASQDDELVLKIRIANVADQDFIEVEIPRWKLSFKQLIKVCSRELTIDEALIERVRKLPNTRLRKDKDVKRLKDFQELEVVLKQNTLGDKASNCYQSISTCKDQTILY